MIITDKTGRKLKVGQEVDIVLVGVFRGKVMAIKDQPIVLAPNQSIKPHTVIQVIATPFIMGDGSVYDVYITGEPDPKDPLVLEDGNKDNVKKLIRPS